MSIKLQQQIKQNSEDIRKYVADLYEWEKEQNEKPKKKVVQETTAPIRGQVDINIQRDEDKEVDQEDLEWQKKMEQKRQKNKNLVRDANTVQDYYKAWDKFDVDQEIDDLEEIERKKQQKKLDKINPYLQDKKIKAPPRSKIQIKGGRGQLMTINSLRDIGNLHFKSQEYEKAIDNYTQCLELFRTEKITRDELELKVTITANRAMAYIKIGEYSKAENDCTNALKIDESHQKSLYRRGISRRKMQKWKGSLQDFEKAKKLDPKNQDIIKEHAFVQTKYSAIKEEALKNLVVKSVQDQPYEKQIETQDVQENIFENDSYIDQLDQNSEDDFNSDNDLKEEDEDNDDYYEENENEEIYEKGKLSSDGEEDEEEEEILVKNNFSKLRRDSDKLALSSLKHLQQKSSNKNGQDEDQGDEEDDEDEEDYIRNKKDSKFNHIKNIDTYHKHQKSSIPSIQEQMQHDVYFRNEEEVISPTIHKAQYDPDEVPMRGICKDHAHDAYVKLKDIDGKIIPKHEKYTEKLEVQDENQTKITIGKEEDIKFGGEEVLGEDANQLHTYKQTQKPRRSILNSGSLLNYQKILEQEESQNIIDDNSGFSKLKDVEGKIINKNNKDNLDDDTQLSQKDVTRQTSISFKRSNEKEEEDNEDGNKIYNKRLQPRRSILKEPSEIQTLLQQEDNFNSTKLKNIDGKIVKHDDESQNPTNVPEIKDRQISIKFDEKQNDENLDETEENKHEYRRDSKPRRSILKTAVDSPISQSKIQQYQLQTQNNDNNSDSDSADSNDSDQSEEDDKHVSFSTIKSQEKSDIKPNMIQRKSMLAVINHQPKKSILKPAGTYIEKFRSKSMRTDKIKGLNSPLKSSPMQTINEEQKKKFSSFGQQNIEENKEQQQKIIKPDIKNSKIQTSIQFMQQWANLKKQTDLQYEFLDKQIIPELLPDIFKSGMDVSLIQDIFKALKENYQNNPSLTLKFIDNVPKVKRFQINRMSMIAKEKLSIQEILNNLKKDNLIDEQQHKSYLKSYQI